MYRLTPNSILVLVGVILIVAWVYNLNTTEGFDGKVPTAKNTSSIPKDVPGSTSSNPTVSKPQVKDMQALLRLTEDYIALRKKIDVNATNITETQKKGFAEIDSVLPILVAALKEGIKNPDNAVFSQQEILEMLDMLNFIIRELRGLMDSKNAPKGSKPLVKDIQALLMLTDEYFALRKKIDINATNLTERQKEGFAKIDSGLPLLVAAYKEGIKNPDNAVFTQQEVLEMLDKLNDIIRILQEAMVSKDVPGSTSSNSTASKPQLKDIQSVLILTEEYSVLRKKIDMRAANLSEDHKAKIKFLDTVQPSLVVELKDALKNPGAAKCVQKELVKLSNIYNVMIRVLREAMVIKKPGQAITPNTLTPRASGQPMKPTTMAAKAPAQPVKPTTMAAKAPAQPVKPTTMNPKAPVKAMTPNTLTPRASGQPMKSTIITPTTVANAPGIITLAELQTLKTRIDREVLRLSNLRSNSPTLTARIDQLGKLSADIGDMISAVQRGTLKLKDVPIKPETAVAFLKAMPNSSVPLPALRSVPGTMPKGLKAKPDMSEIMGLPNVLSNGQSNGQPDVQSLLEHAQYLKWNVNLNIEYDPKLAAQDRLMKRLEEMEQRLTALAISETPIPPEIYQLYLQELQTLQDAFAPKHGTLTHSGAPLDTLHTTYSRNGPDHNNPYVRNNAVKLSRAKNPSAARISAAQGSRQGPDGKFPNGEISPDVYIRPGFVMTDDTIARRGSASAFDPVAVGGLDYKNRVQEICRQIRSGQIGEPDNFGCITNPDTVSSSYSWKGNYEMVCNRLGDTWGGWYPEMFGCPKYDPTAKFKGTML